MPSRPLMPDVCHQRRPRWRRLRAAPVALGLLCAGCASLPEFSHRSVFTPEEQSGLGTVVYHELLASCQVSRDTEQAGLIRATGGRLAHASGRTDLDWEFQLVRHDRPRAVALPGGKVVVSDALLAHCRTEGELAARMAREIGCMLAGLWPREVRDVHSGGDLRLTFDRLTPADSGIERPELLEEADSLGLSLLVRAGYDPATAADVWFSQLPSGAAEPRFVDQPSGSGHRARKRAFSKSLAQAQAVYEAHPGKLGVGSALAFTTPHRIEPERSGASRASPGPELAVPVRAARQPRRPEASGAVVDSDGEFLPPVTSSASAGAGNWSSAAAASRTNARPASDPPAGVQQASWEWADGDAGPAGPVLP